MFKYRKSASLIGFYLLLGYVVFQFMWWGYLMLELNKKWEMVVGEGLVFLVILFVGAVRVRRTFKKETQLARQQSNFLLSVTHELKSPIASARLQLETLLIRELSKEKQKEILTNAISDTDRLNALVENILLAAQIDRKSFNPNLQLTDLSEFVNQLLSRRGLIGSHSLVAKIEPGIQIYMDGFYFESVVLNLLDNACKYSPRNSEIKIELKKNADSVLLEVADQGIGISDSEKTQIFEKFYRVGREETRTAKGTGLGLYIVNSIVMEHGGEIRISDNKPVGTIFSLIFSKK